MRAFEISLARSPLTRFGVPFLRIQYAVPVSSTTEAEEPDLEGGLGGGRTLWPPMSLWAESGGGVAGVAGGRGHTTCYYYYYHHYHYYYYY